MRRRQYGTFEKNTCRFSQTFGAGLAECDEVRRIRDQLQSDLYKLYRGAPRTLSKAYDEASKSLKEMDEMTFPEEEIDRFLPESLRKSGST